MRLYHWKYTHEFGVMKGQTEWFVAHAVSAVQAVELAVNGEVTIGMYDKMLRREILPVVYDDTELADLSWVEL